MHRVLFKWISDLKEPLDINIFAGRIIFVSSTKMAEC